MRAWLCPVLVFVLAMLLLCCCWWWWCWRWRRVVVHGDGCLWWWLAVAVGATCVPWLSGKGSHGRSSSAGSASGLTPAAAFHSCAGMVAVNPSSTIALMRLDAAIIKIQNQ